MTRIIAGFAGSLVLAVPPRGTRPTSDRVREAIFSALESRDLIDGARVLDLFAGSGALGLEAASRGAASVVLVEKDARAAGTCRRNAERVRAAARGTPPELGVVTASAITYLESAGGEWDVVFLDPPYDFGGAVLARTLGALVPHLADDAVVLVERATRAGEPSWPEGLASTRSSKHGDTTIWWATPA